MNTDFGARARRWVVVVALAVTVAPALAQAPADPATTAAALADAVAASCSQIDLRARQLGGQTMVACRAAMDAALVGAAGLVPAEQDRVGLGFAAAITTAAPGVPGVSIGVPEVTPVIANALRVGILGGCIRNFSTPRPVRERCLAAVRVATVGAQALVGNYAREVGGALCLAAGAARDWYLDILAIVDELVGRSIGPGDPVMAPGSIGAIAEARAACKIDEARAGLEGAGPTPNRPN